MASILSNKIKLNFLDDRSVVLYIFAHLSIIHNEIFLDVKDVLIREKKILTINHDKLSTKSIENVQSFGPYNDLKYELILFLIEKFNANINWINKLTLKKRKKFKFKFLENLIKNEKLEEKFETKEQSQLSGFFRKKAQILGAPPPENIFHFNSARKNIIAILKQSNWGHLSGPFVYSFFERSLKKQFDLI